MFSISQEQNQYLTYILSCSTNNSQLEVVPERGGIITRWRIQGQEIFYLDEERFRDPSLSVRGGNPILFPICGNLPDNTYTHNGQSYTLKQHGFARDLPWSVSNQSTQEGASLTLTLDSNSQTKQVYPFDFHLEFTYILTENRLEIQQKYQNLSSTTMPFSAGFHPYFLTTDKNQLVFDIPATEYQDQKTKQSHPFSGNFDFEQEEIDVAFRQLTKHAATVTDNSRKLQLTLTFDSVFATLVFWTLKGKEFYCLEPWTGPRNAINTGENIIKLSPNSTYTTSIRLDGNFLWLTPLQIYRYIGKLI